MPHYNINIRTKSHIADTLKVEKDDLTALRIEMARFVGELLKDHADLIWEDQDWQIDVTDDAGLILYAINISALEAPSAMRNRPTLWPRLLHDGRRTAANHHKRTSRCAARCRSADPNSNAALAL